MSRKNKTIIWLLLFILMVSLLFSIATYAYFSTREIYEGAFKVDVSSKGVDTLHFEKTDAKFEANGRNFAIETGHDVSGEATMNVVLDTTNNNTQYCYETSVKLPDNQVFEYSIAGVPELVLTVSKSSDNATYENVIDNMDITTKTGTIKVPISSGSIDYKNIIGTSKNITKIDYWKAEITFKWFKDTYQYINDFKSYKAVFEANIVEC